ncbi:MAG: tRNA dihydrouridine synthase DusB [Proteobacteria bacterium]|nr:tRNA dihydrouridine synthase DusB [Pseudomonadota bacterium]MBU1387944.1 tRNA dihydrouridine synthase DusB [Pseudomonadota bacterium]MBU1542007.1 tRNA dihydrouridine synthase DusB [Pseudomonadota bacterium]MBU2430568.1 tRNA dihydrouridine synthase DusB [Pseudomonadota bacterium]MBU2482073.1 tRNA dihydrouridine synthase DusB [Pseudomonadota bacterium]
MKIKNLDINGHTFLAPLAGVTNLPFRLLVKDCGCAVVCSEMISAKGIFYNSEKTLDLMASKNEERPLSIQLFGADPDTMAKGAAFVEKLGGADILDINFGCSVKKIIKQGAGVALMKEPELARVLLKSVRAATRLPLTIKIRSGWDHTGSQALNIARIAQESGVDAIIMHPRTAAQGFKGTADWNLIKKLKQQITIPVIGNGDINCVEDAIQMLSHTGCDAIMIGRAAMKNPFILSQIEDYLKTGSYTTPSYHDIFNAMEKLTCMYIDHFGELPACRMLRSRLSWFVKGLPGCSGFRKNLSRINSKTQALEMIRKFENSISQTHQGIIPPDHKADN